MNCMEILQHCFSTIGRTVLFFLRCLKLNDNWLLGSVGARVLKELRLDPLVLGAE